jgi:hypothetical protein
MRLYLCVALIAGCGRVDFDAHRDATAGDGADDTAVDMFTFTCSAGYTMQMAGSPSRYRVSLPSMTWLGAEADCESDGGHLSVVDSPAENTFLFGLLSPTSQPWIGASDDVTEGTFLWVTGASVGTGMWSAGEPSNMGGVEDCASMTPSGLWNDLVCTTVRPYVCECDGHPAAAATYCDTDSLANCGQCGAACATTCVNQICQ